MCRATSVAKNKLLWWTISWVFIFSVREAFPWQSAFYISHFWFHILHSTFLVFSARSLSLEIGTTNGKALPTVKLTTTRYTFLSLSSIHHHFSVVWSLNNLYHSCLGTCAKCATKLSRPTYSLPSIRSVMYDENLCKAGRKYKKPKSIKLADLKAKIMSVTFENGSKHSLKELHASFLSGSDSNFSCCPWFLPHTVTHQINSF